MSIYDELYNEQATNNLNDYANQLRYLRELNETMDSAGCPDDTMRNRSIWLGKELSELYMYRSTVNGPDATLLQRFVDILNTEMHYAVATDTALDIAVRELTEYFALKKHLRDVGIYVNFQTIYPDTDEAVE